MNNEMKPNILALDFDGVICDGLIEYFASTQRAYQQIWSSDAADSHAPDFYKLRPVIETGWEMPILLRALVLGVSQTDILDDWKSTSLELLRAEGLDKAEVVQKLDGVRDSWIKNNLDEWLGLHRFYPGVIERLQQILNSDLTLYIVTTKEGRFVKQLLQQQGLDLPRDRIIGKESKRPKYETLRIIRDSNTSKLNIFFVEDRIKALQQVAQQPDLDFVRLFLADWGYNLESDRTLASQDQRINLLSLEQFSQPFNTW